MAWLVLLLPFTLRLAGQNASPTAAALVIAATAWFLAVLIALRLDDLDRPGPAEAVLRRLTYGPRARRRA
ncbi:hypothetical protein AB0C77_09640 [Streptomyces sp. NPDC048629]|uniref:hypothetical protein n=1 Tax=Streptomyces sp. NPDC048629 TaxID=3154824 RepID=UPI00341BEE07